MLGLEFFGMAFVVLVAMQIMDPPQNETPNQEVSTQEVDQ
jgi:hypothetical protein